MGGRTLVNRAAATDTVPLRFDAEALATLRRSLQSAGFTEAAAAARAGVASMYDFRTLRDGRPVEPVPAVP